MKTGLCLCLSLEYYKQIVIKQQPVCMFYSMYYSWNILDWLIDWPLLMDDIASLAKSGAAMSRCDPYQYYFKQ